MTLVEFLLARLAEKEQSIYDEWDSDGRAQVAVMWTGPEPGYTTVAMAHPGTPWVADGHEVTGARHVRVLYDPADVLAEVEAKRRIVESYREERARRDIYQSDDARAVEDAEQATRRRSSAARCRGLEIAVELLALPYADHPDYRPEFRP